MNAVALSEELNRLSAEIARLERRIAEGEGDIADHILLQATLRTQAGTRPVCTTPVATALEEGARPRNTTQLFCSSTHRIGGRAIVGVFGG